MKSPLPVLALFLSAASAKAAITITIFQAGAGTGFTITQTADNPVFTTDQVTVGLLGGIPLARQSIAQDPALYTQNPIFSATPGTVTKTVGPGGALSTIVGLYFVYSSEAGGIVPILDLDVPMNVPPNSNHQFLVSPTSGGELALPFSWFTAGTTVENSVVFGTVTTTVVIPEPGTLLSLTTGVVFLGARRRR